MTQKTITREVKVTQPGKPCGSTLSKKDSEGAIEVSVDYSSSTFASDIETSISKKTWEAYLTSTDKTSCPMTECSIYDYSNEKCSSDKSTSNDWLEVAASNLNFRLKA